MSELQQAYQQSCATYEYRGVKLTPGLFAVVECSLAFCPITDATLPGCNRFLVAEYGSRKSAEYWAAKRTVELGDYCDEVWVEVLPKAELPRQSVSYDQDIPF